MRKRRLKYNITTNLIYNLITFVSGFILPKCILATYGSDVNGLVNSITRFLGFITFFEFGIGAIVGSALYAPLANQDYAQINRVIVSSDTFFRKIAKILILYIIILLFFYPLLIENKFGYIYTDVLILTISINMFAQYYFGKTNQILIVADQKGYIFMIIESASMIINVIACVILMKAGASIQVVKGATTIVFLARPLFLHLYVKKTRKSRLLDQR